MSPVLLKAIDPKVNQDEITLDQNQKNCNHREGDEKTTKRKDEEGNTRIARMKEVTESLVLTSTERMRVEIE